MRATESGVILIIMYTIKVIRTFAGAHFLRGYQGKCEKLHGHNWKVEINAEKGKLDRTGIAIDFKFIKKELDAILDELDHTCLNDHPYFKKINPSAENIARFIYKKISGKVQKFARIKSVSVWESEDASAEYRED